MSDVGLKYFEQKTDVYFCTNECMFNLCSRIINKEKREEKMKREKEQRDLEEDDQYWEDMYAHKYEKHVTGGGGGSKIKKHNEPSASHMRFIQSKFGVEPE